MKKILFLFILLLLIPSAFSDEDDILPAPQQGLLEIGIDDPEKEFYGRYVKVLGSRYDDVTLEIDGDLKKFIRDEPENYSGMTIHYIYKKEETEFRNWSVILNLTVQWVCGNGVCEENEFCCTDCKCNTGYDCVKNRCIDQDLNTCYTDLNCNDNNPCTTETCEGAPRKCVSKIVTSCQKDGCCPSNCNETNDFDCGGNNCDLNKDCNDNNENTIDECSKITNKCKNSIIEKLECTSDEDCDGDKCSLITNTCYEKEIKKEIKEIKTEVKKEIDYVNIFLIMALFLLIAISFKIQNTV